jgi:hypothetical protein
VVFTGLVANDSKGVGKDWVKITKVHVHNHSEEESAELNESLLKVGISLMTSKMNTRSIVVIT